MPKVVLGLMGGSVAGGSQAISSTSPLRQILSFCQSRNICELDTARVYADGRGEEALGQALNSMAGFKVQTKAPGFSAGSLTAEKITASCDKSLAALNQTAIDLYYFHGPDRQTPLEESCRAINNLHRQGKINAFGVSNYRADEVQQIIDICEQNNWLKPSVYQGGYNPLLRAGEQALFPILRQHNIAFYAYSPLGGGFFSRPKTQLLEPPTGSRMEQMPVFKMIYVNDDSLRLHDLLEKACNKEGLDLRESTLRWMMHHSALQAQDGVVLGASTVQQVQQNLEACEKGPLPSALVDAYQQVWDEYYATGKASAYSV